MNRLLAKQGRMRRRLNILVVITCSFIIGIIYIYPDLKFRRELKNEFKGISFTYSPDELGYLARIKAVYKGNLTCRGIDIYEHKNEPWILPFLGEFILGSIGKSLGLDVTALDIACSFFLPVILFWLLFLLFKELSGSSSCSYSGSFLIIFGYSLFNVRFTGLLKNIFVSHDFTQPLWFLRPISPQFNHVIFIAVLFLFYLGINRKSLFSSVLSGIFTGALFYMHPHYWTYIYASIFVFVFFASLKRDYSGVRLAISMVLVSILLSIPFWLHLYALKLNPDFAGALSFTGLAYTHAPILPYFHILLSGLALFLLWYSRQESFLFFASFLGGGFLCLNQQILTGATLVPGHWQGYTNKTMVIIAVVTGIFCAGKKLLEEFLTVHKKIGLLLRVGVISAVLFLAAAAFSQQESYYLSNRSAAREGQKISGVLKWLNQNAAQDDVVLTDPLNYSTHKTPYSFEILTYTNSYIYQPSGCTSVAPRSEHEERFLYAFKIFGYSAEEFESFLRYASGAFFLGIQALSEYGGKPITEEEILRIKNRYAGLSVKDRVKLLKKYRIDFIVIDNKAVEQYNNELSLKSLFVVYSDTNYCIIKVL